jgi:enoyl-CoA hydratase/carnithine racemase
VCSPDTLQQDALDLAGTLAHGPSAAHAMTKRCLHEEWHMGIDEAVDFEARMQAECMMTNDFERAYRGFVEKQTPAFEGN